MQVGELFVNLGVKGTDKTVQAFTSVKTGLTDMKSMSIETKAALVGAVYALEQLVSASNNLGTNLVNTSAILKMPIKTLQEYNFVARLVGSSNEAMESTFLSLKNTVSQMAIKGFGPELQGRLAQITGVNIAGRRQEFIEHPERLLQVLQQYAQKEKDQKFLNQTLQAFGLSGPLLSGVLQNQFNPENFKKAQQFLYSDKGAKNLDDIRKQWFLVGEQIQKSVGDFNVKYGKQLIGDIKEITTALQALVGAFLNLDKSLPIIKAIGTVISGWVTGINALSTFVNAIAGDKKAKQNVSDVLNVFNPFSGGGSDQGRPRFPAAAPAPAGATTVNQYFQLPAAANPSDYKRAVKDAASDVFNKKVDSTARPQPFGLNPAK